MSSAQSPAVQTVGQINRIGRPDNDKHANQHKQGQAKGQKRIFEKRNGIAGGQLLRQIAPDCQHRDKGDYRLQHGADAARASGAGTAARFQKIIGKMTRPKPALSATRSPDKGYSGHPAMSDQTKQNKQATHGRCAVATTSAVVIPGISAGPCLTHTQIVDNPGPRIRIVSAVITAPPALKV